MLIRKSFQDLYKILEDNSDKKIISIMPKLLEIMQRKNNASGKTKTFVLNDEGNVRAIFCYYHKKWELLSDVSYGKKVSSSHGYNTMCKVGVSSWTKQQKAKKAVAGIILEKVAKGEIVQEDILEQQSLRECELEKIIPREDRSGFDTIIELEEFFQDLSNID